MRCDVLAIGTELLLGQVTDTNSQWIGEQLAAAGIDSLFQAKVGDNLGRMTSLLRAVLVFAGLCLVWQGFVAVTGIAPYLLPPPSRVFAALVERADFLLPQALLTLAEIVLGMIFGVLLGCLSALALASFAPARRWLLPVLVLLASSVLAVAVTRMRAPACVGSSMAASSS